VTDTFRGHQHWHVTTTTVTTIASNCFISIAEINGIFCQTDL